MIAYGLLVTWCLTELAIAGWLLALVGRGRLFTAAELRRLHWLILLVAGGGAGGAILSRFVP